MRQTKNIVTTQQSLRFGSQRTICEPLGYQLEPVRVLAAHRFAGMLNMDDTTDVTIITFKLVTFGKLSERVSKN